MLLKTIKFLAVGSFTLALFYVSKSSGYITDSRGFPVRETPVSNFGMPSANTPSLAPLRVSNPPAFVHQPTNSKHHRNHVVTPYFYYFDSAGYPYYVNSPIGTAFYYNTPQENTNVINEEENSSASFTLPRGTWLKANDGNIPDKAFVYQSGSEPTYYCRSQYKNRFYYGVLTPKVGCYIQDQSSMIRFNNYEVLVTP